MSSTKKTTLEERFYQHVKRERDRERKGILTTC